jgi:hypothetical protein
MRKMQKAKSSQKENSQTAKSEIEWGIVRMQRAGKFIASVGSPSGRLLPRKGADWSRASGRYKETFGR